MRTGVLAIAVAISAVLVAPGVASADPYPAGVVDMTVSEGAVAAGDAVEVSGTGFGANEIVDITVVYANALGHLGRSAPRAPTLRRALATATTDANGNWSTTLTLTEPGVATITAVGRESGATQTSTVTVAGEEALTDEEQGDSGALPITGSRLTAAIVIGAAAVIAGAFLLWLPFAVRRRSRHAEGG